jgi:hypothetical protein
MKIVIGHKVINLEELFQISQDFMQVELVVDSPTYAELKKDPPKETKLEKDFQNSPLAEECTNAEIKAILAVKIV